MRPATMDRLGLEVEGLGVLGNAFSVELDIEVGREMLALIERRE